MKKPHPHLASPSSPGAAEPCIEAERPGNPAVHARTERTMAPSGSTAHADALAGPPDVMPYVDELNAAGRCGDWAINTLNDEKNPLGLIRRTLWQSWIDGTPEWQTVLDIDALDLNNRQDSDTRWMLRAFEIRYRTLDRALLCLAPDGADAFIVLEFDLDTLRFVHDGFNLPEPGRHCINWIDIDAVYVNLDDSATNPAAPMTHGGFPRQVRRWQRGTAVTEAPVVFECEAADLTAHAFYDQINHRHSLARAISPIDTLHYWLDEKTHRWQLFDLPRHAQLREWNDWLLVEPRADWQTDATTYPAGSLLAIRRATFLAGARQFKVLFAPVDERILAQVHATLHWMIVVCKSDASTRVTLWLPPATDQTDWEEKPYPLPPGSDVWIAPIDPTQDDKIEIFCTCSLLPPSVWHADLASDTPWRLLQRLRADIA